MTENIFKMILGAMLMIGMICMLAVMIKFAIVIVSIFYGAAGLVACWCLGDMVYRHVKGDKKVKRKVRKQK